MLQKKAGKVIACLVLSMMMVLSTGFTQKNLHAVKISVDGRVIETRTTSTTPDLILARAGVKLAGKDEYTLKKIDDANSEITVYRAVPVTIEENGTKKTVMTSKPTVGDALVDLGYNLDAIDANPGLDTKIHENLDIKLEESAARKQEAARQQEEQMRRVETSRGAERYTSVLTMEATAYLPSDGGGSGITASGLWAQHGVVAVDPGVIPLGTRLYIPGYGEAIAADTGGAIYGNRIDLCMDTYGEAMAFGRRMVTVYVLG